MISWGQTFFLYLTVDVILMCFNMLIWFHVKFIIQVLNSFYRREDYFDAVDGDWKVFFWCYLSTLLSWGCYGCTRMSAAPSRLYVSSFLSCFWLMTVLSSMNLRSFTEEPVEVHLSFVYSRAEGKAFSHEVIQRWWSERWRCAFPASHAAFSLSRS